MKKFNQIVVLCSFVIVNTISSMEIVEQDKSFICFKKNALETYGGRDFCYDSEYKVKCDGDKVLFPVASLDPLKIETCEHINFFVTSNEGTGGKAFKITDPTIKRLAVVRGGGNGRINAYISFDTDNFTSEQNKGFNTIHLARLINIQVIQKPHITGTVESNYNEKQVIELFDDRNVELALMAYLPEVKSYIYENNWRWESGLFQEKVKEMLGERAKDFNFEKKCFQSKESYWTDKENKLKGTTY